MNKDLNKKRPSGSKRTSEPLATEEIIFVTIHPNTELDVDLKLLTRRRGRLDEGQSLDGRLTRDNERHFTFHENPPQQPEKRNPRVFIGQHITVTRRDDGSLRPNFKPLHIGKDFSAADYATAVANELLWALTGLVGK